jgi:putative ABC transport system ATP-binding protein
MQQESVRAPLLEARRVQKIYRGTGVHVRALDGVDLVVERGELVAIMGPSGRGRPPC